MENLRALLKVMEHGSIRGAANELNLSRRTLKRMLAELEDEAKVELLERDALGAALTPAGERLVERGRALLEQTEALVERVRQVGDEPGGEVRALVPVALPPSLVVTISRLIHDLYPRLTLSVHTSVDPLREMDDSFDLVVYLSDELPQGAWMSRTILRISQVLMASPDYLRRKGTPQDLEALMEHELLAERVSGDGRLRLPLREGGELDVVPSVVYADTHGLGWCVGMGMGIGLMSGFDATDEGFPGEPPVPVLEAVVGRVVPVRLAWPEALHRLPKLRALLDQVGPIAELFVEPGSGGA